MEPDLRYFEVVTSPNRKIIDDVFEAQRRSPFASHEFATAMNIVGKATWALFERLPGETVNGCLAFVDDKPRLARLLVPTCPPLHDPGLFWESVGEACRARRLTDILVDTHDAHQPSMPAANTTKAFKERYEYRLRLNAQDLYSKLSSNHRRNLRKANEQGFDVVRANGPDAVDAHCQLTIESLQRQASRDPGVDVAVNRNMLDALVTSGCAEVWQARRDGKCHSSAVILKNAERAYYYSAGNSDQGLASRSSVLLIMAIAERLQSEGLEEFNLGGAKRSESGLRRFKKGFGSREVSLAQAHVSLQPDRARWTRRLRARLGRGFR